MSDNPDFNLRQLMRDENRSPERIEKVKEAIQIYLKNTGLSAEIKQASTMVKTLLKDTRDKVSEGIIKVKGAVKGAVVSSFKFLNRLNPFSEEGTKKRIAKKTSKLVSLVTMFKGNALAAVDEALPSGDIEESNYFILSMAFNSDLSVSLHNFLKWVITPVIGESGESFRSGFQDNLRNFLRNASTEELESLGQQYNAEIDRISKIKTKVLSGMKKAKDLAKKFLGVGKKIGKKALNIGKKNFWSS